MTSPVVAFDLLRSALEHARIRFAVGGSWASTAFGDPRFTNGVDIVAAFTEENLHPFLQGLSDEFYVDHEEALTAIRRGGPFNVIHMQTVFNSDFFPAAAFPLGMEELDRAIFLAGTGLSREPTPFVTPEDILLAKLHWFRLGSEASEVQWRDIRGIVRACAATLDPKYLERSAGILNVTDLLHRALRES